MITALFINISVSPCCSIRANIPVSEKSTERPASPTIGIKQYPNTETTVPINTNNIRMAT